MAIEYKNLTKLTGLEAYSDWYQQFIQFAKIEGWITTAVDEKN